MRPPLELLENVTFTAGSNDSLITALGDACKPKEVKEIRRLISAGLPPVTSLSTLAVLAGYNPGFVWSLINRNEKYYRVFKLPKGKSSRQIEAPKVGLKLIQKWLSIHFERKWKPHDAVHGFVRGRSHISAAKLHVNAQWVISADIENFFPATEWTVVRQALGQLGYRTENSLDLLCRLCCFQERLAQGSPASPVLSNVALHEVDEALGAIANQSSWRFTRYADDIVISGTGPPPDGIPDDLNKIFQETSWKLSDKKCHMAVAPARLRVHGLLVHGDRIRLTKGYRNRLRAYQHLLKSHRIDKMDLPRMKGHLQYAEQIKKHA